MIKIILLTILSFVIVSCSHYALVKDCSPVQDSNMYACKTLKPWE